MTSCRKILPLKWECLHLPSARRKMVTVTGIEVTLPFLSRKKAFHQILFSVSRGISMMRSLRDGCHTVVWGTFWDDYDSAARDAYFARNGWRNYCVPGDTEILELCPACAVRALRRGETRGLADTWLHPTHAYTHAFREVDAQLSARERVVANLLLPEGRTA